MLALLLPLLQMVLSDARPTSPAERVKECLFSDGGSIWFDKSFCIVISANGRLGTSFEHSWGDGMVPFHMYEFISLFEFGVPNE